MIVPKQHLEKYGLVEILNQSQYQPCGVDMSLKEIHEFVSGGKIDFDNRERKISETKKIEYIENQVFLKAGCYKVIFNEYVRIPAEFAAICLSRSSMLRCGAVLNCALWDPGYEGRSEALLVVHNPHGITLKKDAKIGQMVFIHVAEKPSLLYEGTYKGENK